MRSAWGASEENEENEEEEIKIHGMTADEFYAYICTLIMIFNIFGKKAEDADERKDAKLKSRGGNLKKRCSDDINQDEEHFDK